MKSIDDIVVDDIKSDVAYVKEKEKQVQIIQLLTRRTKDRMNLKLLQEEKAIVFVSILVISWNGPSAESTT
jgi:hypothetical protein